MCDYVGHLPLLRALFITMAGVRLLTTNGCGPRACTTAACINQATITIHRADGVAPALAVQLDIDGRAIQCPAPNQASIQTCAPDVTVGQHEGLICHEERRGGSSSQCRGTGRFEQVLNIQGTPQRIHLTIQSMGQQHERVIEPRYQQFNPNGDGCAPVCMHAAEVWQVP